MENGRPRKRRQLTPGGEVGDLSRGHLAGDLAGRRGPQVGRRRERGHPAQIRALAKDAALAAFASARPGRPASVQDVEIELLCEENDRLSEALKEMAVELTLHREGSARAFRPGRRARERGDQARAVGADRWRGQGRVGAHARVPGPRPPGCARAPLASATAGDGLAGGRAAGGRCCSLSSSYASFLSAVRARSRLTADGRRVSPYLLARDRHDRVRASRRLAPRDHRVVAGAALPPVRITGCSSDIHRALTLARLQSQTLRHFRVSDRMLL
jgi:hypothetical protein